MSLTKTLTGKLERVIEGKNGEEIYTFRGRTQFVVISDEIVSFQPAKAPKTGVRK